jgi:hypothetical protein
MYLLKIECIGDDTHQVLKLYRNLTNELMPGLGDMTFGKSQKPYWVAEITGEDSKYKFKREFLRCKKDYSEANGVGSRGVYVYYNLEEGKVYHVSSPESWKRIDKYYCTIKNGELQRLTQKEVEKWVNDTLILPF